MSVLPDPQTAPLHQPAERISSQRARKNQLRARRNRLVPIEALPAPAPPNFIVDGILEAQTIGLVFGPAGCGKSFLMLDLLCSVAAGVHWMGNSTRKGRGVYVYLEGESASVRRRYEAWKLDRGQASANIHLLEGKFALSDPPDVDGLVADIKKLNADGEEPVCLVVIDTLSRAIPGEDENSQAVMSLVVERAARIRDETGAAVLLVHHSGKATSAVPRGNSVLLAAVDTCLKISGANDPRTVEIAKQRDGRTGNCFRFKIKSVAVPLRQDAYQCGVAELIAPLAMNGKSVAGGNADDLKVAAALRKFAGINANAYSVARDGEAVVKISKKAFRQNGAPDLFPGISNDARRKRIDRSLDRLLANGTFRLAADDTDAILVKITTDLPTGAEPLEIVGSIEETF